MRIKRKQAESHYEVGQFLTFLQSSHPVRSDADLNISYFVLSISSQFPLTVGCLKATEEIVCIWFTISVNKTNFL